MNFVAAFQGKRGSCWIWSLLSVLVMTSHKNLMAFQVRPVHLLNSSLPCESWGNAVSSDIKLWLQLGWKWSALSKQGENGQNRYNLLNCLKLTYCTKPKLGVIVALSITCREMLLMISVQVFLPKDRIFFPLFQNEISSFEILFLNANNMNWEVHVCKDNIHPILA